MDEDEEIDSDLELDDQGKKKAPRRHHPRMDIVSKLLSIVEPQALMGENCNPGSDLNLGEKVVNRYAQVSIYFQIFGMFKKITHLAQEWAMKTFSVFLNKKAQWCMYSTHANNFLNWCTFGQLIIPLMWHNLWYT